MSESEPTSGNGHSNAASGVPYPPPTSIVAIGGSAGGIEALKSLLPWLPEALPAPIVVALHLPPKSIHSSMLPNVLRARARLPIGWAHHGETPVRGRIYLAPQDAHTTVAENGKLCVSSTADRPQPGVDELFTSVASRFGRHAIGIVLSGWLSDGAAGARHIAEVGGTLIVQNRATSYRFDMPQAALRTCISALVLPAPVIAAAVTMMLMAPRARPWFALGKESAYVDTAAVA